MKNGKKIAAATAVIIGFGLYSWHTKHEETEAQSAAAAPAPKANATVSAATRSSNATSATPTYKDGTYTGTSADALYGYIQVKATVSGGKLTDVAFLQYPNDQHESIEINTRAMPVLTQEAIQAQTAQVDGVSGATDTSQAFIESLNAALNQAHS